MAEAVQTNMVSTKTPKACTKPCLTGWDATHTGFVGKETALNTRHERHAEGRPGYCVHTESTLDDQEQNFRNERDIHHGDHRSKEQVSPCHQRHHPSHHSCDAVQAAENHQTRQNCDA